MNARYIVRLDDACPTMRRETWDALESALDRLAIRPVVGVIPDNKDPAMLCSEPDPNFWTRVRHWQQKGWTIALHGLHHSYHRIPSDGHALIPLHNKSEFVGLDIDRQRTLLRESWRLFSEQGVKPSVFMAPSHTFDAHTLSALLLETDIRIITDGHALFPFREGNFIWIPQQLWRFRRMPFGLWTVCLHPNDMNAIELEAIIERLAQFADTTISLETAIAHCNNQQKIADRIFASLFGVALRAKRAMASS